MAESLKMIPWIVTTVGFISGGLLLFIGDRIFTKIDKKISKNKDENNKTKSLKRCIMLILSITLHNIPEGLAVGVAFGGIAYGIEGATLSSALMIALGIGIQNFPEGTAVSVPLRREGLSRKKHSFWSTKWYRRTDIWGTWGPTCIKSKNTSSLSTCLCRWCYDLCSSRRINTRITD